MGLRRLQAAARVLMVVAAAAASAVTLVAAVAVGQFALAVAVLAALLVRFQAPTERWRHIGTVGLVLAVAGVVGFSGGPAGSLLAALLFVMGDYGLARPPRRVVIVGLSAALLTAGAAILEGGIEVLSPTWVWSLLLVPLVGLVAGQIGGRQSLEGTAALESANAALEEVLQLAERMPAGFDRWSVARAVQLEIVEASKLGSRAGPMPQLLVVEQGVLFGVATPIARQPVGLLDELPRQRLTRTWTKVSVGDLPAPLGEWLGDGTRWYLHRLGGNGVHGVVLVPHDARPEALDAVSEVLRPAAVALANVDRFERLEDLAVNSARIRVAHDLHDGVAQALTHVRFELDLLGLEHPELAQDVQQIRDVADGALLEVRRTVGELRDSAPLHERVQRHVELLGSFATAQIDLHMSNELDVPDDTADDVFRLVQEALSNAVRHASASVIRVSLDQDASSLSLAVVDDGAGIDPRAKRGIGLGGMETRVDRMGGELLVRDRRGGGTVVEVEVPLSPNGSYPEAPHGDLHVGSQ